MPCRVVPAATLPLDPVPLDSGQVVEGTPATGVVELLTLPEAAGPVSVGVWEHTTGASTDVETDEVFVVLSGRATVAVDDGTVLELGPGDLGVLEAGSRTTWTVHEPLRKVYVSR